MSENGVFYFAIYTISPAGFACLFSLFVVLWSFVRLWFYFVFVAIKVFQLVYMYACLYVRNFFFIQMCNCSIIFIRYLFMCWADNLLDLMQWEPMLRTLALISTAIMKYTVTEFPIWQINLKLNCYAFLSHYFFHNFNYCNDVNTKIYLLSSMELIFASSISKLFFIFVNILYFGPIFRVINDETR